MDKEPTKIHSYEAYEAFWKRVEEHPERYRNDYEPWFEWDLDVKDADDPRVRKIFGSNVCILDQLKELYNKPVRVVVGIVNGRMDVEEQVYILKGIQVTNEDFYYILHRDHIIKYMTCCAGITEAT